MQQMIRRMLCFLLALTAIITVHGAGSAAQARPTILLDGFPLAFPADPEIIDGYTMVPFRAVAEAMGVTVSWNEANKTITAVKGTGQDRKTVMMQIDNPVITVDGSPVTLPVKPIQRGGHSLIPLSFFSKQFGAEVSWDEATRTVSIVSPPADLYKMAFYAISSFSERSYIDQFDSVAFGWSRIAEDGSLTVDGKDFYWPQPAGEVTPESLVQNAANAGTVPYLMVFAVDGSGELSRLLADSSLQHKAIDEMIQLAKEKKFGGLVLDFEGLGLGGDPGQAKQRYSQFVQALAQRTKAAGLQLSLVLHPLNGAYQGYDYAVLGKLADDLIVMAYAYENETQPEPLAKVNEAVQLALQQVPKQKLILGISMGSENEQSIASKIGIAKRYGLKGIAIWRLGLLGQPAFEQLEKSAGSKALPASR
ncbi:stalk domain-containing protein [Brevibacillus fulvus]|uniref:GH18 domain-containing protein n=1 Tax=Brevibacillus fulvus TaxID=1125967 RepID=A0A938Y0T8_9BACL|nr:stalk domain-containing protein [Brevibacillus fulvus]MBM7591103.1 hypothetical protein [Brevibacillus fulvus]